MISKGVILIVDDEETIRFSIKEFLEGQGYEVHVAETCEQALEKINELLPDLILLDLRLPIMGGIALLEKVKLKDRNVKVFEVLFLQLEKKREIIDTK